MLCCPAFQISRSCCNRIDFHIIHPYSRTSVLNLKKIKFAIYPSNRGGYGIKTIPISTTDKTSKVYFPKEWGGLTNNDLEKVTGIKGSLFCHANRFLMTAKNLDTAIKLAEIAIELNVKEKQVVVGVPGKVAES